MHVLWVGMGRVMCLNGGQGVGVGGLAPDRGGPREGGGVGVGVGVGGAGGLILLRTNEHLDCFGTTGTGKTFPSG